MSLIRSASPRSSSMPTDGRGVSGKQQYDLESSRVVMRRGGRVWISVEVCCRDGRLLVAGHGLSQVLNWVSAVVMGPVTWPIVSLWRTASANDENPRMGGLGGEGALLLSPRLDQIFLWGRVDPSP